MGISWPSQRAQPLGAKFPVKILTSAKNGFDMASFLSLILAGEDPLQGDDEVEYQVGRHVLMRLVAARGGDRGRVHGAVGGAVVQIRVGAPDVPGGAGERGRHIVGSGYMVMRGQLGNVEGV